MRVGEVSKLLDILCETSVWITEDVEHTSGARSPLLPDRHTEPDSFVCDFFNCVPKGDLASLEHPIFSLATKPDRCVRRYDHNDVFVEVKPAPTAWRPSTTGTC